MTPGACPLRPACASMTSWNPAPVLRKKTGVPFTVPNGVVALPSAPASPRKVMTGPGGGLSTLTNASMSAAPIWPSPFTSPAPQSGDASAKMTSTSADRSSPLTRPSQLTSPCTCATTALHVRTSSAVPNSIGRLMVRRESRRCMRSVMVGRGLVNGTSVLLKRGAWCSYSARTRTSIPFW